MKEFHLVFTFNEIISYLFYMTTYIYIFLNVFLCVLLSSYFSDKSQPINVTMWSRMVKPQEIVGSGPYLCQHCDKTYSSGWDLRNHIKVVHGPDKVKCPDCEKCFARQSNLREHLKTGVCNPTVAASYRQKYKCPHCEKCFSKRKSLSNHYCMFACRHVLRISVNKLNKTTTTICGFKYKNQEEQIVHMSNVHPKEKKAVTYEDKAKEDRYWKDIVLNNFSPIKKTPVSEKHHNKPNKKEIVKLEDIDNIEESAINIEMGINQVLNIDSMIEEVSIDTMEEGEIIFCIDQTIILKP